MAAKLHVRKTKERIGNCFTNPTPQNFKLLPSFLGASSVKHKHQQSLVTGAVARFVEGRKLHYTLSGLHRPISIPQWTPAGPAESLRGWVQSCIFHIGDGPHSGHYRCIWRKTSDDNWQSTDDGRSSVAASESDMRQARNGGYILLVRPFLQDQPVAGPP